MSPTTLDVAAAVPADTRTAHLFRHHAEAPALRGLLVEHRRGHPAPQPPQAVPPLPAAPALPAPITREQLRGCLRELPALPQAALQALAVLRDDDSRTEQCAELIGRDPALAARTLRLANSAFYGAPGRVSSVGDAVQLLGRQTLASLLTLATLSRQFEGDACPAFSFSGFWRHALATALAARGLARALDRPDEPAFTVGLLHDIGRLALAVHFPDAMAVALARGPAAAVGPHELERSVLGTDHLDVGAQVAAQWNFPPEVVVAIAGHHAPRGTVAAAGPAGATASLTDLVHAADAVAHALDLAGDAHERVPPIDAAAWARLALPPAAWLRVLADTEAGVADLAQVMGL